MSGVHIAFKGTRLGEAFLCSRVSSALGRCSGLIIGVPLNSLCGNDMKDYLKWLIIGLLIGAGISVGWKASDYYIDTIVFKKGHEKVATEVLNPGGLEISRIALVKTPLAFQVVGVLTSASQKRYKDAVIRAAITSNKNLIDYCENLVVPDTEGAEFKLRCDVSHKDYPSAELGEVQVVKAYVE